MYNQQAKDIEFVQSDIYYWLNGFNKYVDDNFKDTAFTTSEQNAIAETNVGDKSVTNADVFLLSADEVTKYRLSSETFAKSNNTDFVRGGGSTGLAEMGPQNNPDKWYLRSQALTNTNAAYVDASGLIQNDGQSMTTYSGVRPGINLASSNVLFTSAAKGGKSAEIGLKKNVDLSTLSDNDGYKLTVLDSKNHTLSISSENITQISENGVQAGEEISLQYICKPYGSNSNEYISAIITNVKNEVLYYGHIQSVPLTNSSNTLKVTIPEELTAGKYTLKLFSEQVNGDGKTDYASAFVDVPLNINLPLDGSGTEQDPYIISTVEELEAFSNAVNNSIDFDGEYVKLAKSIDLTEEYNESTGKSHTAIGIKEAPFKGTFDGDGNTVNVYIKSDDQYQGLFGYTSGATIKNLTVSGSIKGKAYVGGVAAYALKTTIENCVNKASIKASGEEVIDDYDSYVGGIVGSGLATTIRKCYNTGAINATGRYVGGIVGNLWGTINSADNSSLMENCYNTGSVRTTYYSANKDTCIGGLVGNLFVSSAKNSYNVGT